MSEKKRLIADIPLHTDKPTMLSISDLYTWVIWQFPKTVEKGLCGAVRPPVAELWYPAVINTQRNKVRVFGHLEQTYDTPEAAAEFLCQNGAE